MAVPNYTYLKLKMPSPKGVITIEGSFEQAYYCEQDCITQVATLIAPYDPDGSSHDTERALVEEATKAVAMLDRSSIGEAARALGGSNGSASPSIQALSPPKGVDPIEVSSNLSPLGKAITEPFAQKRHLPSQNPHADLLHRPTFPTIKTG